MNTDIIEKTERYVACPHCGDTNSHRITDVKPCATFGPFFCKSCGTGIVGQTGEDGGAEVEVIDERRIPVYVLLRHVRQEKPIYLVVRDVVCEKPGQIDEYEAEPFCESLEFLYNHQLSPRVYIGKAITLMREGDEDSHELFEYVASTPVQHAEELDENEEDIVFRSFRERLGLESQSEEAEKDSELTKLLEDADQVIG